MSTAEQKELKLNEHFQALDDMLEGGPEEGQQPEGFLRQAVNEARSLVGAIEALTPDDVDEIWQESDEEEEEV